MDAHKQQLQGRLEQIYKPYYHPAISTTTIQITAIKTGTMTRPKARPCSGLRNSGSRPLSFLSRIHLNPPEISTLSIYYQGLTCQYFGYILSVNTLERWLCQNRTPSWRYGLQTHNPTNAVAVTNGFHADQVNAPVSVQDAKAQIGISLISFVGEHRHEF